jgi:hypothetical protein
MNSTTATNTNTTTSNADPYDTNAAKRLERMHNQLAGFASMAQTCRRLSEIHYVYDVGGDTGGLTEDIMDAQARFAEGFLAAFPAPETLDELADATHEAISVAVRVTMPPKTTTAPLTAEPDYVPHQAPANWRTNPSMLTWADVGAMESEEREAALKAMGYTDAGEDTDEHIFESATYWLSLLMNTSKAPLRSGSFLLGMMRLVFVQEMQRDERAATAAPKAKPTTKAKAKK